MRLCFGSRTLFRAQFDLDANGYDLLDQWREDWQHARSSPFYVIRSKDDAGLEVIDRNLAYTSLIGREKFAQRYGLSPHHAAALVIARRALNLSERPHRCPSRNPVFNDHQSTPCETRRPERVISPFI